MSDDNFSPTNETVEFTKEILGFFRYYYEKEPIITNIAVLLFFSFPICVVVFRYLNKRLNAQTEKYKHLSQYKQNHQEKNK